METLLAIVSPLLVGTNIWQLVYFKTQRDRMRTEIETLKAKATEAKVGAKHKGLDLMQDQADYLLSKLSDLQADYVRLQQQMREEMEAHTKIIHAKCNEIAQLQIQVVYLKKHECGRDNCTERVSSPNS